MERSHVARASELWRQRPSRAKITRASKANGKSKESSRESREEGKGFQVKKQIARGEEVSLHWSVARAKVARATEEQVPRVARVEDASIALKLRASQPRT